MFTQNEFEQINIGFKSKNTNKRRYLVKVWRVLLGFTTSIIVIAIFMFPKQFDNEDTSWILPLFGGISLLTMFIGLLISTQYHSEKPFMEFIIDEIIQKINSYEGLFLKYKAYDKEDREFNKVGGLFTRFASVHVKRHISGDAEENHLFNIYDCRLITSSGNSQQTHFYGVYFVLNKQFNTSLQIRTNGSPKLKGAKFSRQEGFEGLKVYKEKEQTMTNIDHTLLTFMTKLSENKDYKRVYLSVIDGQIHLALWYRKHPVKKEKVITLEGLNRLSAYIMSEYQMINVLSQIDNFYK